MVALEQLELHRPNQVAMLSSVYSLTFCSFRSTNESNLLFNVSRCRVCAGCQKLKFISFLPFKVLSAKIHSKLRRERNWWQEQKKKRTTRFDWLPSDCFRMVLTRHGLCVINSGTHTHGTKRNNSPKNRNRIEIQTHIRHSYKTNTNRSGLLSLEIARILYTEHTNNNKKII